MTEGAVVISLRGGDFLLEVGQDVALGYLASAEDRVQLYLEESFSFRIATPEAAIALLPGADDD
ncbi:MAG: encapsulin [Microbacterium sp.]|nr:encapsulin [Microbacterium sp.]